MNNIKFLKTISYSLIFSLILSFTSNYKPIYAHTNSKGELITITVSNNKSSLWLINTKKPSKEILLDNKEVLVTGTVNSTSKTLIYADAIDNSNWDVFKFNIKTKETTQLTNDILGQFNLHFGDENGNVIYSKSGGKTSPIPTISKINATKNTSELFILPNSQAIEDFDVYNSRIVAITFSFDEFITTRFKNQDETSNLKFSIIEMDENCESISELLNINAISLSSISFSASGDDLIIGGKGVINTESGFYKFNLKNKTLTTLLTEKDLKENCNISSLSSYKCCLSQDEQNIYFIANPLNPKEISFYGITTRENALYRYNLKERKEYEVFKSPNSFISSLSFTYEK